MKGTEDMPEPQTINYDQKLRISQKFVDDAMGILYDLPYVEVNDMVKTIMDSNYELPIASANEIVQRIGKYPYRLVKDFMNTVDTNQGAYFSIIKEEKPAAPNPAPEQDTSKVDKEENTEKSAE